MDYQPVDLPPLESDRSSEDDEGTVSAPQRTSAALLAGFGAFGAWMSRVEPNLAPRQRLVGSALSAATMLVGAYGMRRPIAFTNRIRNLPSPALPAIGLAGLAASSPSNSPAFFPSVALTTGGSAALGPREAKRSGMVVGFGYLAIVAHSGRSRRGRDRRQLIWNLGMFTAYYAAAALGPMLGRLLLDVRLLDRARERDAALIEGMGRGPDELRRISDEASRIGVELDRLLLRAAQVDFGERGGEAASVIEASRVPIHHLELAPMLVAAAREDQLNLRADIASMVESYENRALDGAVRLTLDDRLEARSMFDARTTRALLVTLKRALDNSILHGRDLSLIQVTLTRVGDRLRLTIADDGAGSISEDEFGTGLSEARRLCEQLDGQIRLISTPDGVVIEATVLATSPPRTREDGHARSVGVRMDRTFADAVRILKLATIPQGLACLACADRRESRAATGAMFALLVGGEYATSDRLSRATRLLISALVGALWPRGGRPPSGWLGVLHIEEAADRDRFPWEMTIVTTACLALRARAVQRTVESGRIWENLVFPPICAALGALFVWGRSQLLALETETTSMRERAGFVESLAPATASFHDVLDPLIESGLWWLLDDETQEEASRLRVEFSEITRQLRERIVVRDPLRELQRHLHVRLAPLGIEVSASGRQPIVEETRESDRLLERARWANRLIGIADEIADGLLDSHPGHSQLNRVHLHVDQLRTADGEAVELVVQPFLRSESAETASHLQLQRAAVRLGGRYESDPDSRQTYMLPPDALARRRG